MTVSSFSNIKNKLCISLAWPWEGWEGCVAVLGCVTGVGCVKFVIFSYVGSAGNADVGGGDTREWRESCLLIVDYR